MEFLKFFKQSGIKIKLLVTVDSARGFASFAVNTTLENNVKYNLNMYQTNPSSIGSHGNANYGIGVKNVNLTYEKNSKNENITHSNIDEYTLLYAAQVIIYALKNNFSFHDLSEMEIKTQIAIYASQGF